MSIRLHVSLTLMPMDSLSDDELIIIELLTERNGNLLIQRRDLIMTFALERQFVLHNCAQSIADVVELADTSS